MLLGDRTGAIAEKLVVTTRVDPHRLSFACSFKAVLCVEFNGTPIGDEHMLMKPLISSLEPFKNRPAYSTALELRQDEEMRVVDHEMAI